MAEGYRSHAAIETAALLIEGVIQRRADEIIEAYQRHEKVLAKDEVIVLKSHLINDLQDVLLRLLRDYKKE